ncbi:MAG: hypothetical protein H0X13_17945 [Ramlibacter sp.]|nr:hypothetical protein [Ramlibacter sp.]
MQSYAKGGKSYREVANEFNRLHAARDAVMVCKSTVHEWVQRRSCQALAVRCATRNGFPAFTPANLRWCLDGTGKADSSGVVHFILGIIDYGARFNPVLVALERASAWAIVSQLFAAIDRFGRPKIIRTDNAPYFTARCSGRR